MRSFARGVQLVALICAVSLTAQPVVAQMASAKPAAENLFEEGRTLMQQQRYSEACSKFEASQTMDPGIGTLLHLADCYEKMGKTASAWATFKEAASTARQRAQEDRERIALTRASALEQRLSRLTIHVPEAHRVEGLEISLDGNAIPRASWDSAIPVDPGSVKVSAKAPARLPWSTNVEVIVGAGESSLDVPLLEAAPDAAPATSGETTGIGENSMTSGDSSTGSGQRTAGWILGGAGVVGLGIGAVMGMQAKSKNNDSKDFCPNDPNVCSAQGVSLRDDAKKFATGSTIAFVAGGGLLATGIILLLTAPSKPKHTALSRMQVSFDLGPRSNTVHIGSAF